MPNKIPRFVTKLATTLFPATAEQQLFVDALFTEERPPVGVLWTKPRPAQLPFPIEEKLPWQPSFVDRVAREHRPGSHELHNQGYYYCLDLSSVFAATPLGTIENSRPRIVDVCAAPGGKSVFAWRTFDPEQLICNEVIGKRHGALSSNIKRCGLTVAELSRRDPAKLQESYPEHFDVAIVDAPCSGQSLGVKGIEAAGAFHPVTIKKNALRQRRIIANSLGLVRPGGYLLYSTCTFSLEENEAIISWLLERFPNIETVTVPILEEFRTTYAPFAAYRIYPHSLVGAGAFTCLLRRSS